MKLYIPTIGSTLKLMSDWTFTLHNDHRNAKLAEFMGFEKWNYRYETRGVTLPVGAELKVDRIYIRTGKQGFDSVTFRTTIKGKKHRFWAKLHDVNKIEFEEK